MNLPPLYSECYHFTLTLLSKTEKMPKHFRPTLGRRMEEASLDLLVLLKHILLSKGRSDVSGLLDKIDELKLLIQLAFDLRCMSPFDFHQHSESLVSLGKMLGGLKRYEQRKPSAQASS